ncbi:hypothetical protein [Brachyspira sp. G79]|uniref:hypothetical protein n=1 Tax=Brachyspira sp. G79 TaxID=1358104 RepID=UPI000BBCBC46|nr:hypothetical protein [Brachyspira sp. G79]PCG20772.1 hypothetical protein KQ44_12885 [Brachyspira sp. G79]
MIKKTIYISAFIFLLITISCSKNSNNSITNPILEESKYTVKGIDSKYNAVWKFFNADETGNSSVDVIISDGGISGLIVSNKNEKADFSKDYIFSTEKEDENIYYNRYFGYIVSRGDWIGELQFPTYDDETVGYVYIKNKNTSDIIVGILDKAPGIKEGIDKEYFGTRSYNDNGVKKTVDIQENFVTYSENGKVKLKIPSKFFDLSKGDGFYGYTIMQGLLYEGIDINVYNKENSSILPNVYFQYIDYNYKLDINLRADGVPISAKYIKKDTVISSGDVQYVKE